jgi:transcriptional regulator with XRE-family HTH domain
MELFANRIRERARELGLSDAEVARRAGLSERRYGYYATGEREPSLPTLVRICGVLAATPNEVLLEAEKPHPSPTENGKTPGSIQHLISSVLRNLIWLPASLNA